MYITSIPNQRGFMSNGPVFVSGERVVVTNPSDNHYEGKAGTVVDEIFRNYVSEYVYVIRVDDGYEVEFSADELTAVEDYE